MQLIPIIRKAVREDLAQLVEICQRSFPLSLRWQTKRWLARPWWKMCLACRAAQTWVVEESDVVIAFCVVINDEVMWAKEKKNRKASTAAYLVSVLHHPIIGGCRASQYLKSIIKKPSPKDFPEQNSERWTSEMRMWIELMAVIPEQRGRGLSKMLLNHCEGVTNGMGRRVIVLRVVCENTPAKCLYEKHGFSCKQSDVNGDIYVKYIDA